MSRNVNDLHHEVSAELSIAYECLKNADIHNAEKFLDRAIRIDFENKDVLFALKCLHFWKEQLARMKDNHDLLEKGDYLCASWKSFLSFLSHIERESESAFYAFKRFVFGLALDQYLSLPDEQKDKLGAELDFRIGRSRKASGDIETAITLLERAAQAKKNDAKILAELADAYAIAGEIRLSKALFREAFFIDPQALDIDFLESEFIIKIIENVKELGYSGSELAEWIPIFGEIWGAFNVKRELSTAEYNRISASARNYEIELREKPQEKNRILPRLINRYFWLADDRRARGDAEGLNSIILKIKILDQSIFRQYIET